MAKLKPLLLAGLALSALVATSSATPIVVNGSFETPGPETYLRGTWTYFSPGADIDGWHVDNVGGGVSTDIISSDYNEDGIWPDAFEGNAYLYLGDALGKAQVSQVVQLEAGHDYNFSFWLADLINYRESQGALVTTNLAAVIGGGNVFAQEFSQARSSTWTQYNLAFTAVATGDYTLTFTSTAGFAANLDDVRITDLGVNNRVPDAGSTAGLLAGALVVAAGLRRRFVR